MAPSLAAARAREVWTSSSTSRQRRSPGRRAFRVCAWGVAWQRADSPVCKKSSPAGKIKFAGISKSDLSGTVAPELWGAPCRTSTRPVGGRPARTMIVSRVAAALHCARWSLGRGRPIGRQRPVSLKARRRRFLAYREGARKTRPVVNPLREDQRRLRLRGFRGKPHPRPNEGPGLALQRCCGGKRGGDVIGCPFGDHRPKRAPKPNAD